MKRTNHNKLKQYKKIQLIQMIDDVKDVYYFAERTAPHLGLLSIATHLSRHGRDIEIEIMDNAVTPTDELFKKINGDVVGISVNLWNYEKSLQAAEIAKSKGAMVVFGGHHASAIAANILKNRTFVDLVVVGDGEDAFLDIVQAKPNDVIANLVYRKEGEIRANQKKNIPLSSLAVPGRHFVDLSPYIDNFHRALPESGFSRYTTFYSHKGCTFRAKRGPCIFCGIAIDGYRARRAEESWKELSYLNESYGIDYVMDVGDNLTKTWVKKFAASKPTDLKIGYTGYLRSSDVDEEFAKLLSRINCHSIFLGIESGDDAALQRANKGTTARQNLLAAKVLNDNGIKVRMGVVLGLPQESDKSLSATCNHIEEIVQTCNVEGIYTSLLVPIPGSPSFNMLMKSNGRGEELMKADLFDLDDLRHYWAKKCTSVTFDQLKRTEHVIQSLVTPICQ